MTLPCAVVRDLLPLYIDELTGEETGALVRGHLDGCESCRAALEALREPAAEPVDSAAPLKMLKKDLRRRRWRTAAVCALVVFLVLFTLYARATAEIVLSADEARIRVEGLGKAETGEDALFLSFSDRVAGVRSETVTDDVTGETNLYLQAWRHAGKVPVPDSGGRFAAGSYACSPVPDRVFYGFGGEQTQLWGEEMNGGVQVLPRLVLGYYVLLAAALSLALGLLWLLLRRKKAAPLLRQLFLAPLSYLVGHALVMGANTLSFRAGHDFLMILAAAAAFYALATLLLRRRS